MSAKPPRVPRYRPHSSGQARVTLAGKDHLLGPYGSPESHEAYQRVIAEWLQTRGQRPAGPSPAPLTVGELILAYYRHAEAYYGFGREPRGDRYCLRDALRVVRRLYASTPAKDFGPLALKACRAEMVRKGWSRTYVNAQVGRLRRMFRWGAEEELILGAVYHDLRAVAGLRRGKGGVRETERIKPVPSERVEAVLPWLPPPVAAMVRFQLLTGCRPNEVCRLRPGDLDAREPGCWVFRPGKHKTEHLGQERMILVGPRAQEVLRPFLAAGPDAYCFSPAAAERERSEQRRCQRKTPMTPSQRARQAKSDRKRAPRPYYAVVSYRNAIYRACDRAFPLPERLAPRRDASGRPESRAAWRARLTPEERAEVRAWRRQHRWHPNQLRHSRATELRAYGLDLAKTVLGHTKVETTQIYAEKDVRAAMELVAKIG